MVQDRQSLEFDIVFIRRGSYGKIRLPNAQSNPQKLYDLIIQK